MILIPLIRPPPDKPEDLHHKKPGGHVPDKVFGED